MEKRKKGKNRPKKNLNKVVQLAEFRGTELAEDLDHSSTEELEDLRLELPAGNLLWKMTILLLVEDYHKGGDPQRAWDTLGELLDHIVGVERGGRSASALSLETKANLLAFMTAAGLRHALEVGGDTTGTVYWLKETIAMMQYYDRRQGKHQPLPAEWVILTEEMMKLTSLLGNNEMVLEIYRTLGRLCKGAMPPHLAGIAAFNLKEYAFAATCWEKMNQASKVREALVYAKIARQAAQGIVPPFAIDYKEEAVFMERRYDQTQEALAPGNSQEKRHQLEKVHLKEITNCLARGVGVFNMLAEFYKAAEDGFIQQASFAAYLLLINTGAWGLQLFRNLTQDTCLPQALRDEMNHMLESAEILPAEEITLYGQPYKVVFEDKRLNATWDIARELRRRKRDVEAKDMILQAMNREKVTTPELVMQLASLASARGEWQETLDVMIALEKALPGDLAVLNNQALAYYKLQKWDDALAVLDGMKRMVDVEEAAGEAAGEEAGEELSGAYTLKTLENMERWILRERGLVEKNHNAAWNIPDNWADIGWLTAQELRGTVETKHLPKNTSLRRGLKNMPVEWVRFACLQHGVLTDALRKDLEAALEKAMLSGTGLQKTLEALDAGEEEVLHYLLIKGGTAGTGYLVRKHGSMEEDGYFWEEGDKPLSTLGRLWSKCLIMVGRGLVNGKRQKVALIPTDLLPHIQKHFTTTTTTTTNT